MSNVEIDTQSKTSTLSNLIEVSAQATGTAVAAEGTIAGYENQFVSMIDAFSSARLAGNTETEVRKALQADQKASGTKHYATGNDGCSMLDLLAQFHRLSGDLPESADIKWVYRPATTAALGLLEGERSINAAIAAVRAPKGKADLRANGHEKEYGKPVVEKIFAESTDKTDALVRLIQHAKHLDTLLKEVKESEKAPKSADKFLKAATGPINKVVGALDAGLVDDIDTCSLLIESLIATLEEAKKHAALVK